MEIPNVLTSVGVINKNWKYRKKKKDWNFLFYDIIKTKKAA